MAAVLVIEPDESVRREIVNGLDVGNHTSAGVADGTHAIDWVERNGAPDVAVIDLELPDMRPLVLKTALRSRGPDDLPTLFISRRPRRRLRYGSHGPVLVAPFEPVRVLAALDETLLESAGEEDSSS